MTREAFARCQHFFSLIVQTRLIFQDRMPRSVELPATDPSLCRLDHQQRPTPGFCRCRAPFCPPTRPGPRSHSFLSPRSFRGEVSALNKAKLSLDALSLEVRQAQRLRSYHTAPRGGFTMLPRLAFSKLEAQQSLDGNIPQSFQGSLMIISVVFFPSRGLVVNIPK